MSEEPITPRRTYLLVGLALIAGTALTVAAASVDLGRWNLPLALLIAASKATLILLFFMHLRYSSPLTRVVLFAGLVWLLILISGVLDDYITRGWIPPGH